MKATYFLSDIHFADPHAESGLTARAFLASLEGRADTIYLVGDVFDFWLGYKHVIFSAYLPVIQLLERLVKGGTRVVLFSGNHDPDPGHFLAQSGLEIWENGREIELDGQRVWLEHGDLIDPRGWVHRLTCRIARSPIFRRLARRVHPDTAWRVARLYAKKEEDYSQPLPAGLITDYFPDKIRAGYETVVIGHYHRAVHHVIQGPTAPCALFVLGDWVKQFTFLRYGSHGFELCRYHGPSGTVKVLSRGDHGPENP
ncbi:MAG: UDP-2,3-diacylglucosamine diphosphatase [Myxococcota bacterium]|nr:UDP-2,3-diacylglucosamine diphosphatase [Myxococcota bacterium]